MKKLSTKLDNKYVGDIINRTNGITLISLVITIVILIILSAVAISLTLEDNGIFNKAKEAKEEYKQAELNEQIALNETAQYVENIETEKQKVTSIELDKTELTLYLGEKEQLEVIIVPTNAYNKNIEWVSDNEEVAIVSSTGEVTAKSSGTAKIEAKTTDESGITASCVVTVLEKVYLVKDGIEQVEFEEINIKSHTQEDDYALIETETTSERAAYQLANIMNLDEYKSIKVDVEVTNFVYSTENYTSFEVMITKNIKPYEGAAEKNIDIMVARENYKERNTYTLNIEKDIGMYGLGIRKNRSPNTSVTFKLYNMWLEK